LNRWGGPSKIVNALHDSTMIERTDSRWRVLPTVLIQPNGHRVEAKYNDRGLLDTLADINPFGDGQVARTAYQWNDHDKVEVITAPTGEVSRFGYNAAGDREWQEDGRGSLSRTRFTYNAQRQLQTITPPGKTDLEVYRFDYDPILGNLKSEVSPLGTTTTYHTDAIGRVDSITSPINDDQNRIQTFLYDLMDRVKVQRDIGPAVTHLRGVAPAVTLTITTTYDNEGNPLSIERRPDPDFIQRGFPQTQSTYDNAGRKLTESDFAGHLQTWSYDPAGNPRIWNNGRGNAAAPVFVTTEFDWLNRPSRRTEPSITRPAQMGTKRDPFNLQFRCEHPARFPYFSAGVVYDPSAEPECDTGTTSLPPNLVLPADVLEFAYDKLGNVTTANNNDARITRDYYPNGALKTEVQAIALFDDTIPLDGRFNSHRYQLDYTYDLSGRRQTRTDGIPFCQACVQAYHYDPASGFLDRITDGAFGYPAAQFGFQYDSIGRLALSSVNGSRSTTDFQYDNDGRLTTRDVRGSGALVYRDVLGYDRSSRVIGTLMESDVLNPRLRSTTATYNGLGALSYFSHDPSSDLLEDEFVTDGIGRRITDKRWLNGQYTTGRYGYELDRLTVDQQSSSWESNQPAPPAALQGIDTVTTEYAPTGSVEYRYRAHSQFFDTRFFPQAVGSEWTWHVYGADERLRATQRSTQTAQYPRTVFSEYKYDALGRRVAMRTRWDQFCQASLPSECLSTIERTIWDGDQILAEIRTPAWIESDNPSGAFFGVVRYTHGSGIDQPLAIWKADFGGTIPHRSWRGLYEAGTPIDANTHGVSWPARTQDVFFAPDVRVAPIEPTQWIGSLVEGKTDPSGLMYMRNRYYDPKSGQFTQQDPIGLAGGVNLYGFAGGDPVNFSDPFGLCPDCILDVFAVALDVTEIRRKGWSWGTGTALAVDALAALTPFVPAGAGVARRALGAGSLVPNGGGVIRSFVTKADETYYRVFSKSTTGAFLTKAKPRSQAWAREALALPSGNDADFIQEVLVPAGTRLQRSRALPAFGRRGGGEQFELLDRIPSRNFKPGVPFP
jgi:RHS repeat-associated protein